MPPCWFRFFALTLPLAAAPCVHGASNYATPYIFTTLTGVSSIGTADGNGKEARFNHPWGIEADSTGALYVGDTLNGSIRKITADGRVSTFVGKPGDSQVRDGMAGSARFALPGDLIRDTVGNLYVEDFYTIRKITPDGTVSTLAGQAGVSGSDDGSGANARFAGSLKLTMDPAGNIYAADFLAHTIRKITAYGAVTTLAGRPGIAGQADGTGQEALFKYPTDIAADKTGVLYVADSNGVRKITPDGTVTTWANLGVYDPPLALAVDSAGTVYFSRRETIWKLSTTGSPLLLAGRSGTRGSMDGPADDALFDYPRSLAVDLEGNLFVAEPFVNAVRRLTPAGIVSTWAGLSVTESTDYADGRGNAARFGEQLSAVLDRSGDLLVADKLGHAIRKVTADGSVTTIAGTPGISGSADGAGSEALFSSPDALAVDRTGNIYVSDTGNHTIRKITPGGIVSTLAGSPGLAGSDDGIGRNARFQGPYSLTISPQGDLYTFENRTVRRILSDGSVSTLAVKYDQFFFPNSDGLAFNADGRLFLAGLLEIIEISPSTGGFVQLLAGRHMDKDQHVFGGDGIGETAHFYDIGSLAFDQAGNAYVTDTGNNTIRRITPAGETTTLGGLSGPDDVGFNHVDGLGSEARFAHPSDIAIDASGTLYVTDGSTIRKGQLATGPVITAQPQSQTVVSGNNATFSVTAGSNPAPTYQWYLGNTAITGATSSTLTLTATRASDAGDYTVVVTNTLGSVTSAKATLTVTAAPVTPPTPAPSGGGGGGAPSHWFMLALLMLGAARLARRTANPRANA